MKTMGQLDSAVLVRSIRRWNLVALVINIVIGAGIFGLPSKVYALIGAYSIVAFLACALVVSLIVLCFAEVASHFRETRSQARSFTRSRSARLLGC
jgi:amino acid transporter